MIITLGQQKLRSRLRWTGRVLFIVSAILLGYVALVFVQAEIIQAKGDRYLVHQIPPDSPHPARGPTYPRAEGDILGRIMIPRLGLSAVILEGTESRTLRLGVGHIRGTAIPGKHGNTAIAGHRDIFFRSLKGIHADDEIQLETEDGSTRYVVVWARIVVPDDISVLDSTSESALTLVNLLPLLLCRRSTTKICSTGTQSTDGNAGAHTGRITSPGSRASDGVAGRNAMKPLLWIGVIVFVLGIGSFFVPFPQRERQTLTAGGMSVGVETTHSQTLPAAASLVMMIGGLMMAAAGGLLRKGKA